MKEVEGASLPLSFVEVREYEKEYQLPTLHEHPRVRSLDQIATDAPWISFLPAFSLRTINLEVVDQLTVWALSQSTYIQRAIWAFLDEPDEPGLQRAIEKLSELGVSLPGEDHKEEKKIQSISVAELIRRALPTSYNSLLLLVQQEHHNCRRPAATVRQALRRMRKKGQIIHDERTDTYRLSDE